MDQSPDGSFDKITLPASFLRWCLRQSRLVARATSAKPTSDGDIPTKVRKTPRIITTDTIPFTLEA